MGKIDELIQMYCPDGVEYKRIDSYTQVLRGKRLTKDLLSDENKYPVYHGGLEPLGFYNSSNRMAGTVMVINVGASAGTVGYSDAEFWSSDGCFCIDKDETVNDKFLYHYLKNNEHYFVTKVRKAGIPTLDNYIVESFEIPVPPLPVQEEIVRILDSFTELETELETELNMRQKQFEYYRDKVLSLDDYEGEVVDLPLGVKEGGIAEIYDGTHQTPKYTNSGVSFISVENIGNIYNSDKFISNEDYHKYKVKPRVGDIFMTRIGSIGTCALMTKEEDLAYYVSLALIRPDNNIIDSSYLRHYIESKYGRKELYKRTLVNAVPIKVNKDDIGMVHIRFPKSVEEQRRIADFLDKFSVLTTDIAEGLPAEIKMRHQQYEYYRDKLLTFKRMEVA